MHHCAENGGRVADLARSRAPTAGDYDAFPAEMPKPATRPPKSSGYGPRQGRPSHEAGGLSTSLVIPAVCEPRLPVVVLAPKRSTRWHGRRPG